MSDKNMARRTKVQLYVGGNIKSPDDVNKHIQSVTYTDSKEKNADDLQIVFDDREKKWIGDWIEVHKNTSGKNNIKAVIVQQNWEDNGKDAVLNCGVFDVDTVTLAGPPAKITLKAAAISYSNAESQKKRSRPFKNVTLKDIASKIASEEKYKLMYEAAANPFFKRKEQTKKTNIKFLEALCKSQGLSLKIAAKIIVIFDESEYGKKGAIKTISPGDKNLLNYSFKSSLKDKVYTKCTVSYKSGKTYKRYTYTLPGAAEGKTLSEKKKVNTLSEAKSLAKASITKANSQQFTGTVTTVGAVNLVAGNTVTIKGFQKFDGKYMIDKATHKISGGYTTTLELSKA